MKLSDDETNLAILSFKTRIYVSFAVSIFSTIAFIIFSIIAFSNGHDDLAGMALTASIITAIIAILTGIYIFKRRSE